MFQVQVLDCRAGRLANHIQLAFQCVLHDDVSTPADENLSHHRFFGAHGRRHGHFAVHRYITPPQQDLAFGLDGALHLLLTGQPGRVFLRQEDHADAILSERRQQHALRSHFLTVQRIWQLQQNAGAVAHQFVGTHGAAMVQVLQDFQGILDNGV